MLTYEQHLLGARVNTFLGSVFIASFALGAGLLVWHTAFGSDPLESALVRTITPQTLELP